MNYERILIVKPSAIGDITTTLPALHSLRRAFPQAKISWLVRKEFAPLLEGHPELDEIIIFDRKLLGSWWWSKKSFLALKNLIKQLKCSKFDLVMDFQGLFRSGLFTAITGSPRRVGMSAARELAHLFYTKQIAPPTQSRHVIDYYQKMVEEIGVNDTNVEFILPASAQATAQCVDMLKSQGADPDNFRIFVAGASEPEKCWQSEKFAALARMLIDKFGGSIVIVGTKADSAAASEIISLTNKHIINLTGQTTLPQLVALMHLSKLIVSNDTGPGHIAIATKRPAVIIFGYTNPIRLYPYNRLDAMVVNDFEGRGLKLRSKDPKHSIKQITVEQVFDRVLQNTTDQ